jgi:hypothetical protein
MKRSKDPLRYSYLNLKHNAKRRGKAFELSFEDFKAFCRETNYLAGKGKTITSYSIDRIDNDKGYVLGNIRILSVSDNAKKGTKKLEYDYRTKQAWVWEIKPIENMDDMPF